MRVSSNPDNNTAQVILRILESSKKPLSVKDIIKQAGLNVQGNRKTFNSELYSMERKETVTRHEGTPPLWSLPNQEEEKLVVDVGKSSPYPVDAIHVMIDVDNSPCLREAEPYAEDLVYIWAYASPAYNHYAPESSSQLCFHKLESDEDLPSAADVRFCMRMTELCLEAADSQALTFIIVSKDKILHTMVKLHAKRWGCQYEIVQNSWEGLRVHLE